MDTIRLQSNAGASNTEAPQSLSEDQVRAAYVVLRMLMRPSNVTTSDYLALQTAARILAEWLAD